MIIINLPAIIIIALALAINYFFYSIGFNEMSNPEFYGLTFLMATMSESLAIRAKIYYIPLWVITLAFVLYSSFKSNQLMGIIIATIFASACIILAIMIREKIETKKWKKSKALLNEYLNTGKSSNINQLLFYPNYLFTDNPFYEKYIDFVYTNSQNKWFNKTDVKEHYLSVIKKIEESAETEEERKKTAYIKSIIESKLTIGMNEYLIENLKKRIQTV